MSEDAGREMTDMSMVNCWRRFVSMDLYADFFKHVPYRVSSGALSLIRWVCEFALIRGQELEHQGSHGHTLCGGAPQDNEHLELIAKRGKAKVSRPRRRMRT